MTILAEEVWQVQNPSLGALLIWRFVVGYTSTQNDVTACPLPLLFIVLPTLFHSETARHVRSTRPTTGLRGFAAKFSAGSAAEADLILAVHDRAREMRQQTLDAIRTAVSAKLLSVDIDGGSVYPLTKTKTRRIGENVRRLADDASKLGGWCAALTLFEVASTLKVRF